MKRAGLSQIPEECSSLVLVGVQNHGPPLSHSEAENPPHLPPDLEGSYPGCDESSDRDDADPAMKSKRDMDKEN